LEVHGYKPIYPAQLIELCKFEVRLATVLMAAPCANLTTPKTVIIMLATISIERILIGINNLFRLLPIVLAYHDTEVCSQSNSVAEVRALEVLAREWTQNGQRSWCDRLSFTTHFVGRSYFLKMKHNHFFGGGWLPCNEPSLNILLSYLIPNVANYEHFYSIISKF
jgi:hypothetical protein